MKKKLISSVLMSFIALAGYAQLSLSGEIRPRTELYNGTNSTLANKDERVGIATQQRSRLYFSYASENGIKIVFTPQLVHFWGQMPQAYDLLGTGTQGGPDASFSVFEAYAEYKASELYTLSIGRQAISYNDQRWFGALGWAATGRAHDAVINKFSFGETKLDVGLALNQTKHMNAYDSAANASIRAGYKSLQYAWLTMPLGDLKLQAMVTNVTKNDAANASASYDHQTTVGLMPSYSAGDLSINASAYYQSTGSESSAYLLAADITYKGLGMPITLGADIVSGDDPTTTKNETWQQPFGTNHKFYGFMDFFYVGETASFGLNDLYAKAVIKTGEKTKIIVMPHAFLTNSGSFRSIKSTDTDVVMVDGGYLGAELDLVFNYNVTDGFNFKLGYSKLFASDLFEDYKPGDAGAGNQWAWMQLTFKPKFL